MRIRTTQSVQALAVALGFAGAVSLLTVTPNAQTSGLALGSSEAPDFTGDGYADIADHVPSNGNFYIRENYQNGTFAAPGTTWGSGTSAPSGSGWRALVGDFTGDGYADYADFNIGSRDIYIHENLHNGTFATSTWGTGNASRPGFVSPTMEVVAADINGDGRVDLFLYDPLSTLGYYWIPNNGPGTTFTSSTAISMTGPSPTWSLTSDYHYILADVNADNRADLIVHRFSTGAFTAYQGGVFSFGPAIASGTTSPGYGTIFGDYEADGYADYSDVDYNSGQFWIHKNQQNGTFAPLHWAYGFYNGVLGWAIFGIPVNFI